MKARRDKKREQMEETETSLAPFEEQEEKRRQKRVEITQICEGESQEDDDFFSFCFIVALKQKLKKQVDEKDKRMHTKGNV